MARCLILIEEGFPEDILRLRDALAAEGHTVDLVGPKQGETVTGGSGTEVVADRDPLHLDLNRAHLVVVPDGPAAEKLAKTPSMVNIVYSVLHKGRLVATIGLGTRILVSASTQKSPNPVPTGNILLAGDFLKTRRVTGDPAVKEELEKAGARFTDRPTVVDPPLITARTLEGAALDRFLNAALPHIARAEQPVVATRSS